MFGRNPEQRRSTCGKTMEIEIAHFGSADHLHQFRLVSRIDLRRSGQAGEFARVLPPVAEPDQHAAQVEDDKLDALAHSGDPLAMS